MLNKLLQKSSFIALTMILCNTVWAEDDWVLINSSPTNNTFVSPKHIKNSYEKHLDVWVSVEYNKKEGIPKHNSRVLNDFDCQSHTRHSKYIAIYRADGSIIVSEAAPANEPTKPIIPNSVADAVANYACSRYGWGW